MKPKRHKLTHIAIKPYGRIIDSRCAKTMSDGNGWGILLRVRSRGWRIAYLILRARSMGRLECHDSHETFEPVSGKAVIALAKYGQPADIKLFFLDRAIVIKPFIWHSIFTFSEETHIKIVENIKVRTKYHNN